jgi:hypothetical protein
MEREKIYMNGITRRVTYSNEKIMYSKNKNGEKVIVKVPNSEEELHLVRTQRYTKEVSVLKF